MTGFTALNSRRHTEVRQDSWEEEGWGGATLLLGPQTQSEKVNHYLRLTPHTHAHTRLLLFLEVSRFNTVTRSIFNLQFWTLSTSVNRKEAPENRLASIPGSPSVSVCFCASLGSNVKRPCPQTNAADVNRNKEDMTRTARGGVGLLTVPYFLSQHPLSSRRKSTPKVKGHPGGISFVLSSCMFSTLDGCFFFLVVKKKKVISPISPPPISLFRNFTESRQNLNGKPVEGCFCLFASPHLQQETQWEAKKKFKI